ncbi:MAG: cysteine hydrolase [Desulfarculaceae bacterium]|nr:cysteine hydrolase [Desulfarculaceae bacterium]MCF8048815.1 cysteine hydrolase [Desulfarculaceae bacterium]MCF8064533.1 cysteine hydrolase [Desulfarculaceae bacterium]MCF8098166.1 cysteine hydrolase [Desulfarculaceae bacterium]MCF8121962.1 cysteine hydrolase [Desulfarculaceae bacterium]
MTRALLVIDVQMEYFSGMLPISHPAGSLERILEAMDAAATHKMPVVVIQHQAATPDAPVFAPGGPGVELHPQVAARPRSVLITKQLPGSFTGTALGGWLLEQDVDTVTICGYMTQMCCDTTSRQAFHRGLSVEFLSDATGTLDMANDAGQVSAEQLHRAILVTQAARFAKVLTTQEWIASLAA